MRSARGSSKVLQIKKYSNRRFYDTTRSCHVSLNELYDLVCQGYTLELSDSKSGQDITNVVLTQIILERDAPKLAIFPAEILHQMIRTKEQFLGSVVEEFFRQVLLSQRATQEQWARFWQNTLGINPFANIMPGGPANWARSVWGTFGGQPNAGETPPSSASTSGPPAQSPADIPPDPEELAARDQEIRDLRQQLSELASRLEHLSEPGGTD